MGGRLLLNVAPGGDATELAADGGFRTVWKRLMAGEKVDFEGRPIRAEGAQTVHSAVQNLAAVERQERVATKGDHHRLLLLR